MLHARSVAKEFLMRGRTGAVCIPLDHAKSTTSGRQVVGDGQGWACVPAFVLSGTRYAAVHSCMMHASSLPTHLGRHHTVVPVSHDETGNASSRGQYAFKIQDPVVVHRRRHHPALSVNKIMDNSTYTRPMCCSSFKVSCRIIRQKPVMYSRATSI